MKKSKKLLSVLCAVCMVMAMAAPAMAAGVTPTSDNQMRVVDDEYFKNNEEFSGDYFGPFTVTAERPYVRVAIQNTASSGTLTLKFYKIVDGKEIQIDTVTAAPGKWGQSGVKNLADTEICVRMSMPSGYTPEGVITIRTSAQDFLRSTNPGI